MAKKGQGFQTLTELCENCNRETPHDVTLEIKKESKKQQNAEFSREPYRTTRCLICGDTHSQRMNNA
ncbi:hypothetical protein [Haladaptatus sp. CMAA 1911]|uniref:DUF7835 family putative zinc beta-ribbon protein n=1 Tax=unclassified Haladaptatus TaxID=2622732 RepID=UPI0037553459